MKVFISYAREDKKVAIKLYNDLKEAGLKPWLDQKKLLPGQNWKHQVESAIKSSDFFIALLSNNSVSKVGYVQKELKRALDILDNYPQGEGFVIPVRLDECKPTNEILTNLHWADLFDDYDFCLNQIISAMKALSGDSNDKESHDNTASVKPTHNTTSVKPTHNTSEKIIIPDKQLNQTISETKEIVTSMEFVRIKSGVFMMGQTEIEKKQIIEELSEKIYDQYFKWELPRHEVYLNEYSIAKYPVTVGQFRKFVDASGYKTDAEKAGKSYTLTDKGWDTVKGLNWKKPGFEQNEEHPAVCLSWNDAVAMANWLSEKNEGIIRLPTEAEWEYACRAGTITARFWGDDPKQACQYANVADLTLKEKFSNLSIHVCTDGYVFTSPVGTFLPNPWGLYDMLGNVWEWCADAFDEEAYRKHEHDNPLIDTRGASFRVLRGGSWDYNPAYVRCAWRIWFRPDVSDTYTSLRLLWTVNF